VTWSGRGRVAVAGVGFSAVERRTSTPIGRFALDAAGAALADCGLDPARLDGLATYPTAPFTGAANREGVDVVGVEFMIDAFPQAEITWYAQSAEGMITASIRDAVHALLAGACTYVLVWRAMYVPPGTYGQLRSPTAAGDAQFAAPYGCVSPIQWHALAFRAYLERYGGRRDALAALAVNSRRNAALHPHAVFRDRPLTVEDYRTARAIADPLCLYDCDVPVTACVAIVLTTTERAADLRRPPVTVAAAAHQAAPRPHAVNYTLQDHLVAGPPTVRRLLADSGLGLADLGAAQLYDGFAPSTLYWLEAAGFCGPGEALEFIQDGRIALDGPLPLNTFGGSLSQGRLHGMGHVAEAVEQLRGDAGPRQVPGLAQRPAVLVLDGSPMLRGGGLVFTAP
jgi:acetyl-CoA acetyltransferase